MQTETDTTYNGWKNYETWSVALIVDNDEGLYNWRHEIVRSAVEDAPSEHVTAHVADAIKDWVEDFPELTAITEGEGNYLAQQLLGAALSEVDWYEIAENWMSDLES